MGSTKQKPRTSLLPRDRSTVEALKAHAETFRERRQAIWADFDKAGARTADLVAANRLGRQLADERLMREAEGDPARTLQLERLALAQRLWDKVKDDDPDLSVSLTLEEAKLVRAALFDAMRVPLQRLEVGGLQARTREAGEIYLGSTRKGRAAEMAAALGLIDAPGKVQPQYPHDEMARRYDQLTVTDGLSPTDAVGRVTREFGSQSKEACLKLLQRTRQRYQEMRAELAPYEDVPVIRNFLEGLPEVEALPSNR